LIFLFIDLVSLYFKRGLQQAPDAVFSTAVTSLKPEDAFDTNRVKCVVDNQGYAIYFSRGLIPFNK
jgi:3-deoxy-manno-octulosonate cytidylyltransferase (CMP-KDO synthetase)